jgi:hypothetical protein
VPGILGDPAHQPAPQRPGLPRPIREPDLSQPLIHPHQPTIQPFCHLVQVRVLVAYDQRQPIQRVVDGGIVRAEHR